MRQRREREEDRILKRREKDRGKTYLPNQGDCNDSKTPKGCKGKGEERRRASPYKEFIAKGRNEQRRRGTKMAILQIH